MVEVVIVKATFINKTNKAIPIKPKYFPLFKNYKFFSPGRTIVNYPITDERLARLITDCEKDYPDLVINITSTTIEEIQ